ncbi:MAG: leader peptide processing enzyme [Treponema sp.]|jgi:Na+-driven multidrug efflux pump|nr:leader peptide processing enzyme [Treponema sp.]
MNKKANTLLFILGATVFNILTTVISFFVLYIPFALFLQSHFPDPQSASSWGLIVCMIAAFVLSFVIYRVVLKQLLKKIDAEKHFDPIFGNQRKR